MRSICMPLAGYDRHLLNACEAGDRTAGNLFGALVITHLSAGRHLRRRKKLFADYKIHTAGIVWKNIPCVRVTPHGYTRFQDPDKLVGAIEKIARG